MNYDMVEIAGRIIAMQKAEQETTEDGLLYEDEYVTLERKGGVVSMTGKPIRCPIRYANAL